jgi:hypothetical protein
VQKYSDLAVYLHVSRVACGAIWQHNLNLHSREISSTTQFHDNSNQKEAVAGIGVPMQTTS